MTRPTVRTEDAYVESNRTPDAQQTSPTVLEQKTVQHNVQVQLQYLKDDPIYKTEKPLQITPNFLDHEKKTNVKLAPGNLETIQDVRGNEHSFSLDKNGFRYVHAPTTFQDWSSQPMIAQRYLPELEALLKREVDGCDEIMFYDARIRHADDAGVRVEGLSYNPFAKQVHTDNTERSVLSKIRNLTEMKADYLLTGRARIINIWRPIKHAVYDCGLAIADGGKLQDGDIIECDRHRQDTNEFWDTMGVIKYRPGFDWFYMSYQDEPDVLLFKNYDSSTEVAAKTCLHTAFDLPSASVPRDAPTRESIEVRALIFTYPNFGRRPSYGLPMPHPLAESLEQNHLKRVDTENSITDRLRTDIDEGNEVKDAILLWRRHEMSRLTAERDSLARELDIANRQLGLQGKQVEALQAQVSLLNKQLKLREPELREQVNRLTAQMADLQWQRQQSPEPVYPLKDDERTILHQQLEFEIQKWKGEAMGRGNEAVSRAWQASVDEAVRCEREKDATLVNTLRAEIERLSMQRV